MLCAGLAAGTVCLGGEGADGLLEDFRMLSMEKLRFLAGCEAGGRMTSDAASNTSVGVRGGEANDEKLDDIVDLGDEDGNDGLGETTDEAGESQTLMIGEDVSLLPSSVLIW